jgi:hypothetical protein
MDTWVQRGEQQPQIWPTLQGWPYLRLRSLCQLL